MGKKIILGSVTAVLLIGAVAVFLVVTRLDRFIQNQVEAYGSAATGTVVRLRGADVSLTESRGALRGVTIGNPGGFGTDYAIRIDDIELQVDLGSLRRDVLVINEVHAHGAHLNAEQRGQVTNLSEIRRHMDQTRQQVVDPGEEGRIIIDRFRLTNARLTITFELLDRTEDLELGDVTVTGIGRGTGGATYEEASQAILRPILTTARAAVQERLRDEASKELEEEARRRLRGLIERN